MKLKIATAYFPVDSDIRRNQRFVLAQMRRAKSKGADVIQFPEAGLSGYAGADFQSYKGFDWDLLKESTDRILEEARKLKLWVVLGSTHRLSGQNKPHNSLYIINERGQIVDRYDKRFCAGSKTGKDGDLAHYSSGNHFCEFKIRGIRCGALICHDYRYPELYRQYKLRGTQIMFHSFHAGHIPAKRWKEMTDYVGKKLHKWNGAATVAGITMLATMQSMAANNYVWISCANTSARRSCWPSFMVRPDGVIAGRLNLHASGILITTVDTNKPLYDSTVAWRERAIKGKLHSGVLVKDKRSKVREQI